MKINMGNWKEFEVRDLFEVVYGVNLELVNCTETTKDDPEAVAFVSRTESNNGVSAYVKPVYGVEPQPKNTITVAGGGSVLSTFLQTQPFYSGRDLYLLYSKEEIPHKAKLFIVTIIKANKYRYNYGRQANTSLPYLRLRLPTLVNGKPDWEWMESYIDSLHSKPLKTKNKKLGASIDPNNWKWFQLGGESGLFDIRKGKRLTAEDQTEGFTPYIGAIDSNNGVSNLIGQSPLHEGNTISLSYNGSVGEAFYQPLPYWATDDVNVLYLRPEYGKLNPAVGLFICSVLRNEKYRYSYGRKWTLDNMKRTMIKLPATFEGVPDWGQMEEYIKSMPYGDRL
jgi:hypothetical protein